MIRNLFAVCIILLSTISAVPAFSDEGPTPRRMLEFLQPTMLVGMQVVEGTTDTVLTVYTKEEFALACAVAKLRPGSMDASEFVKAHPSVREKLAKFQSRVASDSPDAGNARINRIYVRPLSRTSFGTIRMIGEDYVLIELEGDVKRRRILPQASIGRIELDGEGVRFFDPLRPR